MKIWGVQVYIINEISPRKKLDNIPNWDYFMGYKDTTGVILKTISTMFYTEITPCMVVQNQLSSKDKLTSIHLKIKLDSEVFLQKN